jgi:hypothetical protein
MIDLLEKSYFLGVTPCLAEVYQHFRGTYSLDLQAAQKMEAAHASKTSVNFFSTIWHHIT